MKPLAAKPLVERLQIVAAISVELSSSASGSNIRYILEDIEQIQEGSSETEVNVEKVDAENKVKAMAAKSKAALTRAKKNQAEGVETQQAESKLNEPASDKEKQPDSMPKARTETMPRTTVPEDPTSVAFTSDNLVKPSTVDWSVRGFLATFGGSLLGNPFSALIDLVPHDQLTCDRDHSTQDMTEWMIYYQHCVSTYLNLKCLFSH